MLRYSDPCTDFGPITIVYTSKEIGDLIKFVEAVNALQAHGGGDTPEYALDGMLAGLRATAPDGVTSLMTPGSQMVVLTDAPTKNENLEDEIVEEANNRGVCVHFLISRDVDLTSNSIYQRIADNTSGTIEVFTEFTFSNFVASYRQNPCDRLNPRRQKRDMQKRSIVRSKRQARLGTACKNFYISSFAYLLKVSIEAARFSVVNITQPNGTIDRVVASFGGLAVYSKTMPSGGQWRACVDRETLKIALSQDITFDTSILFINEGSEMPSTTPPPLCK